jgi:hypothetical protein
MSVRGKHSSLFYRNKEKLYNIKRRSQELKRLKNLQQFFSRDFKAKSLPYWDVLFKTYLTLRIDKFRIIQVRSCISKYGLAQHSTAQHSTAQHSTAQHSTAQHSTAQHSIARA